MWNALKTAACDEGLKGGYKKIVKKGTGKRINKKNLRLCTVDF